MAKIGLIDVDNWNKLDRCFPNLPLMKLSNYHKKEKGDTVEWYNSANHYDVVYMSKVFSFTPDFTDEIHADTVIRGGSGYAITLKDNREVFDQKRHIDLSDDIEHTYPDYSLYNIDNTAYGFMSRGCPRGCLFCHVKDKEGYKSYKVGDLKDFWTGQKNINLLDPNTLACPDWEDIFKQLIDSNAYVNFTQGIDIRLMTDRKCEMLNRMKLKHIHFAWDRYEDKDKIVPRLLKFKRLTGFSRGKVTVYILTNYDTTIAQDLERVEFIRSLNFQPYIMRYNKKSIKRGSKTNALARYVNSKWIFWQCPSFDQYLSDIKKGMWI